MTHTTNNTMPVMALSQEQQQILNDMAQYAKRMEQLAVKNTGKWVAAGYAAGCTEQTDFYCYCGIGKGYKGAPLVPANGNAVLFTTKQQAERKAQLLKYTNGHGQRIVLRAMPANEYYWQLHDDICRTMYDIQQAINNK